MNQLLLGFPEFDLEREFGFAAGVVLPPVKKIRIIRPRQPRSVKAAATVATVEVGVAT